MIDPALVIAAAGLALAPAVSIPYVSERTMIHARDVWLLAALMVATVWVATRGEAWLSCMGVYFLCRWRSPALLPHLLTWVAVAGTWFAGITVVATWPVGTRTLLVAAGCYQAGRILGNRVFRRQRRPTGTMGSPVLSASMVALTLPMLAGVSWLAWLPGVLAVACVSSWLAILALLCALGVLLPPLVLYFALAGLLGAYAACRGWLTWTPRDNSFDSVWARLNVWPMTWDLWRAGAWRWGAGPDTFMHDAKRYRARTGRIVPAGDAHNEVAQMAYEYGVLGVLTCLLFVARVAPHLHLGDPWSAAWIAGGVIAMGSYPARHVPLGLTWLAITAGVVTR